MSKPPSILYCHFSGRWLRWYFLNNFLIKRFGKSVIEDAKQKEKEIIEEAKNVAQRELQKLKKGKDFRDKEIAEKKNADRELQKRRQELEKQESYLNSRLEKIDSRAENLKKEPIRCVKRN